MKIVGIHAVQQALLAGEGKRLLLARQRQNPRQQQLAQLAQELGVPVEVAKETASTNHLADQGVALEVKPASMKSETDLAEYLGRLDAGDNAMSAAGALAAREVVLIHTHIQDPKHSPSDLDEDDAGATGKDAIADVHVNSKADANDKDAHVKSRSVANGMDANDEAVPVKSRLTANHKDGFAGANVKDRATAKDARGTEAGMDVQHADNTQGAADAIMLLLDGVTDPGNFGACIRSAAIFGASGIIVPKDRSAPLNEAAVKAASGGASLVPVFAVTNLARSMKLLKEHGFWLVGAVADESSPATRLGNQAPGPHQEVADATLPKGHQHKARSAREISLGTASSKTRRSQVQPISSSLLRQPPSASRKSQAQLISDIDLGGRLALVLGGEGRGLRQNTRSHCDLLAQIPMPAAGLSLNVSVATGICLYEATRQRKVMA